MTFSFNNLKKTSTDCPKLFENQDDCSTDSANNSSTDSDSNSVEYHGTSRNSDGKNEPDNTKPTIKSQHWNGDWNIPEFYKEVFSDINCQIQTIVFHPVWYIHDDPGENVDEKLKIANQITKQYNNIYRKEFFDNFFWLVKECEI